MTRHDEQRLRFFNRQARKRKTIRTGRRVAMAVALRGGLVARVRRSWCPADRRDRNRNRARAFDERRLEKSMRIRGHPKIEKMP